MFDCNLICAKKRVDSRRLLLVFTIGVLVILFQISFLEIALAQTGSAADSRKPSKRTTINFEDQLIEGRTQKPELFVLLQNRMNNSRRLFKLRENFLPEMRKTAEDVGRSESNVRGGVEPAK